MFWPDLAMGCRAPDSPGLAGRMVGEKAVTAVTCGGLEFVWRRMYCMSLLLLGTLRMYEVPTMRDMEGQDETPDGECMGAMQECSRTPLSTCIQPFLISA